VGKQEREILSSPLVFSMSSPILLHLRRNSNCFSANATGHMAHVFFGICFAAEAEEIVPRAFF
jgi:hypothetical protein